MKPCFDSHFHIFDPRFPVEENHGNLPPPFTVENYREKIREKVKGFDVKGGAVVSGSFQGFDQTYLLDALNLLGPNFVGITQLPAFTSDEEILRLDAAGVRGIRFNLFRGGSEGLDQLEELGVRVYDLAKWHVELYLDSKILTELLPSLLRLPKVSIDHLGLSQEGLPQLVEFAERGGHVKASGFSRGNLDVCDAIRKINQANPNSLMFGTDFPCTRAPKPFTQKCLDMINSSIDEEAAERIFYSNATAFYRIKTLPKT